MLTTDELDALIDNPDPTAEPALQQAIRDARACRESRSFRGVAGPCDCNCCALYERMSQRGYEMYRVGLRR